MTNYRVRGSKIVLVVWLLMPFLAACASAGKVTPESLGTVRPGSVADLHFSCRLQTGEVVAATDMALRQTALPKSPVFLSKDKDGPVSVTAAVSLPPESKDISFEEEIMDRLAVAVIGMKEGESRTVKLAAENLPERPKEDYVIRIARIRERPKEMRIPVAEYRARTGKSPEQGQVFSIDPAIPGRVESVTKDDVVILFHAKPGDVTLTPFGPGRIRETEKTYEIVIDAQKGSLVRSGGFVGRITGVDDNSITIDYRNPLGGETLSCDVMVEKVADPKPIKEEAGK
jgi:FKBP-type peptidyl-prolyl cis-trans isomerase 2